MGLHESCVYNGVCGTLLKIKCFCPLISACIFNQLLFVLDMIENDNYEANVS